MITKDEMMGVLIQACPSFAPEWQAFLEDFRDEAENLPLYVALSALARHISGLLAQGDTPTLRAVFAAVERLHVEGDPYVREAICIGLLEDLQNPAIHSGTAPAQVRPFLGPESAKRWADLDRFWTGGTGP